MKREYKQPVAKFIDYAYEEQVVAESSNFNGSGDGNYTGWCTFTSGSTTSPCTMMLSSDHPGLCDSNAWSLR